VVKDCGSFNCSFKILIPCTERIKKEKEEREKKEKEAREKHKSNKYIILLYIAINGNK